MRQKKIEKKIEKRAKISMMNFAKTKIVGVFEFYVFLPALAVFFADRPAGDLPGTRNNSNATRKAPESSGSTSCRGLAWDFIFANLPGFAGQMKHQGQICCLFLLWLTRTQSETLNQFEVRNNMAYASQMQFEVLRRALSVQQARPNVAFG